MALLQFSTTNIANSLAEKLATSLLEHGYLLYWKTVDCLQTPDGWYPDFFAQQELIIREAAVAARLEASKGVLTISNGDFSIPKQPTRPTIDGYIRYIEDIPVPSVTIDVLHLPNGNPSELGSRRQNRYASLTIFGLARDYAEQQWLMERLRSEFDQLTHPLVYDHDAGTKETVGTLTIVAADVSTDIYPAEVDATAFEFTLGARLQYEA